MSKLLKYHKIQQTILDDIASGKLPVGSRLPGREELIRTYGVARATLNQALAQLTADGVLQAARKRGTFVAAREERRETAICCRIPEYYDLEHGVFKLSGLEGYLLYYLLLRAPRNLRLKMVSYNELRAEPSRIARFRRLAMVMPSDADLELLRYFPAGDTVLVNRSSPGFSDIGTDQREGMRNVTRLLRERLGENAVFVYLDSAITRSLREERLAGFLTETEGMKEAPHILSGSEHDVEAGLNAIPANKRLWCIISNSRRLTGAVFRFSILRELPMGQKIFYADVDNFDTFSLFGVPALSLIQNSAAIGRETLRFLSAVTPPEVHCRIPADIWGVNDCFPPPRD